MEPVQVERFYLGCLAHASYMVGSKGVAAVIDPQRDVGGREMRPCLIERDGTPAEPFRDGAGALLGPVRHQRDLHALIAQTGRGQLGHVPCSQNERAAAGEIAEDLAGNGNTS